MGLLKWNGLLVPLARYAPILCFSWNLSSFSWTLNEVLQLFKRFNGCWLVIYNLTFYIWLSFWMSYVCGWVEGDWVGFGLVDFVSCLFMKNIVLVLWPFSPLSGKWFYLSIFYFIVLICFKNTCLLTVLNTLVDYSKIS